MGRDVYYFSHDVNASNDPKIIVMKELCGVIAYAWWWILIEQLAVQEDYKLPMDKITFTGLGIAFGMKQNEANASSNEANASKTKQAEAFINLLINECELLETDGEYFWSPSLVRRNLLRKNKQVEISRKRSEAGRLGGLKSAEQRSKTKQMLQANEANEANQAKGKERKGNNIERDTRAREDENPLSMFEDEEVKNKPIYELYMKSIGVVSPAIKERLDDLVESYGKERVIVAINTTADNGGNSIKYVETVTAGNLKKEVNKDFGTTKRNSSNRGSSRKDEQVDWQAEYERVHGKK
ncbi:Lin1244/Lin1753 domain-containing protein [uncultured Veillonella sp.]|uniref:Lin1244/Lin1753 domain-containing protein n=1 Tax=uncultured Veillonella sp. TaxID=159268 RepID=UPI0028D7C001|nr:Lin1244/Lin1753 domain-containing protein [uncultured Veillonella sp.]